VEVGVDAKRMDWWHPLIFKQTFNVTPVFVAMLTTFDDSDPAHLRYDGLSTLGVRLHIEEDQDQDWERIHSAEKVAFLALQSGPEPLQAIPAECYFLPTAFDVSVVAEPGKVTLVTLKEPNERANVYAVLVTLPSKGTLFQYQPESDTELNVSISEINTKVDDLLGRVLYQAYDFVNIPQSDDWFTFKLQDDFSHVSNVGTVEVKMSSDTDSGTVKIDTRTKIETKPFVIVLGVIGFLLCAIIIGFFGVFLFKRKKAREELEGFLSLSENVTDAEGGTTYFSNPDADVEDPGEISNDDSMEE